VPAVTDPRLRSFPAQGTLDDLLGFELLQADPDRCRARFAVGKQVMQPLGLVHGGAYAALAETLVSWTTAVAVGEGSVVMGQSNHSTFLRPVTDGHIHAEGTPRHQGRSSWVWDVDFTDDAGRLCALARVVLAVRPAQAA
jgi:1,4-dihydroxy-2-naphthoyl-CoA hydrolase